MFVPNLPEDFGTSFTEENTPRYSWVRIYPTVPITPYCTLQYPTLPYCQYPAEDTLGSMRPSFRLTGAEAVSDDGDLLQGRFVLVNHAVDGFLGGL